MTEKDEYWIGFDLGGTKMLSAGFDDELKMLGREKKRTKANEGTKAVVDRIIDGIEKTIDKSEKSNSDLSGIGIGVPGTIDLEKGIVIEAPNLGWKDVPLKQILSDRFECEVVLCNDVDAGLYGEHALGSAKNAYCAVGVFPGTGVGGGCVIDGKMLQGKRRTAMEIGHIPLYMGGPMDGAGNEGTLESIASRLAIASASAQAVFRGAAPNLKELAGTDLAEIRSGILASAIKKGDKTVETIVKHATIYLGKAVITLIHLFSPDVIVLGGGLAEAMPELIVKGTRKYVDDNVLKSFVGTYEIVEAKLGDDAAIIGAAAWGRKSILK